MADVWQRIKKRFDDEADKQMDIMVGGAALALSRYEHWGQQRLLKFMRQVQETWCECGDQPDKSILMMLEEETGIELKNSENGKSYHDLDYLNGNMARKIEDMSSVEILYMRTRQIDWLGTQLLGSVMLSMHRIYGWGAERDTRLMHEIFAIKDEFGGKHGRIAKALKEETGIAMKYYKESQKQEDGTWA